MNALKQSRTKLMFLVFAAVVVTLAPTSASAQINSGVGNVSLNAVVAPALTVSVSSGTTVNFTLLNNAVANGDTASTIQTSWNLNPGTTTDVKLFGYFDTPTVALTDGAGNDIPSSKVEGRMSTGSPTSYTAFSQTNPLGPAGGSLLLFSEGITGGNKIKTRTDNLELRINLTGTSLPAGTYTGTLRIQAQAL